MHVLGHIGIVRLKYTSNVILGNYELNTVDVLRTNNRCPQYTMTNDPEKVWPRGIIPYMLDPSLGKFSY